MGLTFDTILSQHTVAQGLLHGNPENPKLEKNRIGRLGSFKGFLKGVYKGSIVGFYNIGALIIRIRLFGFLSSTLLPFLLCSLLIKTEY